MDEKQLQLLWDSYGKNGGFSSFDEFRGLMNDSNSRKVFFEDSNKELGFKDYNEFEGLLGVKKKESSNVSQDFGDGSRLAKALTFDNLKQQPSQETRGFKDKAPLSFSSKKSTPKAVDKNIPTLTREQLPSVSFQKQKDVFDTDNKITQPLEADDPYFVDRANKGNENRTGFLYNKLVKGVGRMVGGASDNIMNLMTSVLPDAVVGEGGKETAMKQWREEVAPVTQEFISKAEDKSVTKEQSQKYNDEFLTSALGGLAESTPAMVAPKGTKLIALVSQAEDAALESINSTPKGKELPESTKTVFSIGVGLAQAALEKVGLDKIFGKQSTVIAKNITGKILKDLIENSTQPITKEIVEAGINTYLKDAKRNLLEGGKKLGQAAAIEAVTGGLQEGATVLAETITNKNTGQEIFEPKSWGEQFGRILKAAGQEAVGGLVLGGVSHSMNNAGDYIADKVATAETSADIDALKQEIVESVSANKNLSEDDILKLHAVVDDYARVNSKIPQSVPPENRKNVSDKILEREEVETQIQNKTRERDLADPAFQEDLDAEISMLEERRNQINGEIKEEAAKEVTVLPPQSTPEPITIGQEGEVVEEKEGYSNANKGWNKDVGSTTKELERFRWDHPQVEVITDLSPNIYANFEALSEDYHQYKKQGTNTEFTKAVEQLLGNPNEQNTDTITVGAEIEEQSGNNFQSVAEEIKIPVYREVFKNGSDEDIQSALKDVSDQWHDEGSREATEKAFPKEIIDEAKKQFPQESQPSLNIEDESIKESPETEIQQSAEVESTTEPPINETPPPTTEGKESEGTRIVHAQTAEIRKEIGAEEYEKKKDTYEEWDAKAAERIKNGDLPKLYEKIRSENNNDISAVEQRMLGLQIANLNDAVSKNPTNENIAALKEAVELSDLAGSREGKALAARKGTFLPDNTLGSWMLQKQESVGADNLTEAQKQEVQAMHKEYEAKAKEADKKWEQAQEEISALKAELALKTEKGKRTTIRKKNEAALKEERKDLIKSIKDKWKNVDKDNTLSSDIPYRKQLTAITPDVMKLVRNLLETGTSKLSEIVDSVYEELKDIVKSKKDIHDIIAGEYNPEKLQLTELQQKAKDLREEASLINKLETLQNGKEPTTEKTKRQRNKEITDLRQKIKDFKKEQAEAAKEPKAAKEQISDEEKALKAIKKRNENELAKIEEKIKNKDYTTKKKVPFDENVALKKANPKLYNETMDAIVAKEEARTKFEIAKFKDEMSKRGVAKKVIDGVVKTISTAKALKAGIDFSSTFVQLGLAVARNPAIGAKAQLKSLAAFSPKQFKRQIAEMHSSPYWDTISKIMEVQITEPSSLTADKAEELYSGNLLDQSFGEREGVEGKSDRKGINPWTYTGGLFERQFTSMSNNVRFLMAMKRINYLQSKNMTPESHPEEYKISGRIINEMTARGKMDQTVQSAMPAITPIIWAPKMLSSTLNILGLGDIAAAAKGEKGLYRSLETPEAKKYAASQIGGGIGMGALVMTALVMKGWDAEEDPRSTNFGTVTSPDGNTSYNVYGRYANTARVITQIALGQSKTAAGKEIDLDARGGRGATLGKFFRGKMTPFAGMAWDYKMNSGKNSFTRKKMTLKGTALDMVTPMSMQDVGRMLEQDGTKALLTRWIPSVLGIQTRDKRDFIDNLETLIERNADSETQDQSKIFNYKNKIEEPITDEQFDQYNKTRNEKITKDITKMYNTGATMVKDAKVVTIPYKKMTPEEIIKETTRIKTKATRETKEELFGEKKKSRAEKRADKKLKKIRQD